MNISGVKSDEQKPAAIDWTRLHRRLESAQRILEQGASSSPEAKRRILRDRAKALAWEAKRQDALRERIGVVEFVLAEEVYAIETAFVREVSPLIELTPLPGTPPFVSGIISVHGRILPVVDIKRLFGLPDKGIADLHKVVIVHEGEMELGILADEVTSVRSVFLDEIGPPPSTFTGIRAEYLRGVTKEALIILDTRRMLSDPTIAESPEG